MWIRLGERALAWPAGVESDDLTLDDAQLAAAALQALPRRPESAMQVLRDLSR